MAKLEFRDFEFSKKDDMIRVNFLKYFYFDIPKAELEAIGSCKLDEKQKNVILFPNITEKRAQNKFSLLLNSYFPELKNSVTGNKTVYIHQNSSIPLVGTNEFGLVDRDTNCIEIKPITLCNLNCIYCSVDSGPKTRKKTDYVVEEDYLVQEFEKLAAAKHNPVEAHIGPQGEPLMYADLVLLVKDLKALKSVKIVSMDTNGLFLTEKRIDELKKAGLDRINLSINATEQELCDKICGVKYPLKHILKIIDICVRADIELLLAPVIVPGINEDQVEKLIKLAGKIQNKSYPRLGVQNFLNYAKGRNPAKQRSWDEFMQLLKDYETKTGERLLLNLEEDFGIMKDSKLDRPMRKGEILKAEIVCPGPYDDERIGVAKNRCITIVDCKKDSGTVKVKILREKHNIYKAVKI